MPIEYWKDKVNQRQFFERLAEEFCIQKPESYWYQITKQDVESRIGESFLETYYEGYHIKALESIFPEFQWQVWRYQVVPRGYWDKDDNIISYIQWLADKLNIREQDDWYLVTVDQIDFLNGSFVRRKHGNFISLLAKYFPKYQWSITHKNRFSPGKTQTFLTKNISTLFPNAEVQLDYKHPDLVHSRSNMSMEFDIFLPSLALAFEYQGIIKVLFFGLIDFTRRTATLLLALHLRRSRGSTET